jgi:hypothetical protein
MGLEWEEGGEPDARQCVCWRAVDHRVRSATPVCVGVRWTRLVVVCAPWRCASRRKFAAGGVGVNCRCEARGLHGRGRVAWVAFFGAPPATRRIPHVASTSSAPPLPERPRGATSALVRVGERWPPPRPAGRPREQRAARIPTPCPSSSTPRMPSTDRRSAAKRTRSTLCAVPAGAAAPVTATTEADPPRARRPRRTATCEAASVDATTSDGASLASARSTQCAPPSAATGASSASRSEPLDALSLAQREASVAPHTPARPPSAPGPRARLAPPRKFHLPRFGIGGGDS